jgi:porphobilinogen synthase
VPGADVQAEIPSVPGVFHQSVDRLVEGARAVADIVQQAIRTIKRAAPSLVVIADTCLCEYTAHGHCGIPRPDDQPGFIDNDRSL